jgi:hypothetical protein
LLFAGHVIGDGELRLPAILPPASIEVSFTGKKNGID